MSCALFSLLLPSQRRRPGRKSVSFIFPVEKFVSQCRISKQPLTNYHHSDTTLCGIQSQAHPNAPASASDRSRCTSSDTRISTRPVWKPFTALPRCLVVALRISSRNKEKGIRRHHEGENGCLLHSGKDYGLSARRC